MRHVASCVPNATRCGRCANPVALAVVAGACAVTAAAQSTERVSIRTTGDEGNDHSWFATLSAAGRFVTFESLADDLVSDDTNGTSDIFVHDRQTGQTTRVSVDSAGGQADDHCFRPAISGDGRYVVFYSAASNLVPDDTNGVWDVFVHDRQTGTTTRVSVDSLGAQANGPSIHPAISANGRYVVFHSMADNLAPDDTNDQWDVFVHDLQTAETVRVSVDSAGREGNDWSEHAGISADGRYVVFHSAADNLVAGDTNGVEDVFVHDRATGETTRVSVDSLGGQGDGQSVFPWVSPEGRYVAFESEAGNLVPDDANGLRDVFVHDRATGETTRVSVSSQLAEANGESFSASISADGLYVAFWSHADNLVPDDTNSVTDAFIHHLPTASTMRLSVDAECGQANGVSIIPAISPDGFHVVFQSFATNLVPNDTNAASDVFVRDWWIPGDLEGDFDVDQGDLGILLTAYGIDAGGDLDGDGDTDQADLGVLLAHWGQTCP